MKRIGMYEAKTHLSQLCEEVARTGEAYVVSRNGRPMVKIVPFADADGPVSVWDTVEEAKARYGPLDEFDLPERITRPESQTGVLDDA